MVNKMGNKSVTNSYHHVVKISKMMADLIFRTSHTANSMTFVTISGRLRQSLETEQTAN
jgi:hypothetical protein